MNTCSHWLFNMFVAQNMSIKISHTKILDQPRVLMSNFFWAKVVIHP